MPGLKTRVSGECQNSGAENSEFKLWSGMYILREKRKCLLLRAGKFRTPQVLFVDFQLTLNYL